MSRLGMTDASKGRALLVVTATFWSTNGALIKLINQSGAGPSAWAIAFYRSLFAGIALTPIALGRLGKAERSGWWIASVLCFTGMTATFILANTMTTAANAIILEYTAPIWVFVLSPVMLAERPARRDWAVMVLGMLGVGVLFAGHPGSDYAGLLVGLAGGLTFGLLTLVLRRLHGVDPIVVAWINSVGSAVAILPIIWMRADFLLSQRSLVLLIAMGVFQFGLPYVLYSWGLRYVTASQGILIALLEPVLNPVWAWIAVGERPDMATVFGGILILGAVVWPALRR